MSKNATPRRTAGASYRWVLPGLALGILLFACSAHATDPSGAVYESGLTVEVGVSLLFLDVEVVDANGEPVPGLTREDFSVRLNRQSYPIHSVDDLCGCAVDGRPDRSQSTYFLFFDFSQLTQRGREVALGEAERWVLEVKRPTDRAMVVIHTSAAGLRRLCPLTDDAAELLEAIRTIPADPERIDPFADGYPDRFELCRTGATSCRLSGVLDYRQSQHSGNVLLHFLTRLDTLPGRKVLLLFYQNNSIYPARLYSVDPLGHTFLDGEPTDSVPDLESLIGEIAGTAVATGAVLYPISSGPACNWSIDFGEALARKTGGRFNRDSSDRSAVVDGAGRGCACMYRIGLEPPPSSRSRVLRVKVAVGDGDWLEPDFRLVQLTEEDRWRRTAGAVLVDPDGATDIPVAAAIVPLSATARTWDVKLQVALDPRALQLLPEGAEHVANWEVGAVLVRREGRGGVEMLGVSRARCPPDGCARTIVHERTIEDLEPGTYELRAFAHDRWSDAYGGARTRLELPRPGRPATVGPVLLTAGEAYITAELPLWRKKSPADASTGIRAAAGVQPLGAAGAPRVALSWICGKRVGSPLTTAGLSREGTPVPALERADVAPTGPCWSVRDTIETSHLATGIYDYELRWISGAAPDGALLRASFEVAGIEEPPRGDETEVSSPVAVAETAPSTGADGDLPKSPVAIQGVATPRADGSTLPESPTSVPVVKTVVASSAPRPSDLGLPELLDALALEAARYRDTALRFTCDETIAEQRRVGRSRTFEFEYIYAHDAQGRLRDHRRERRASARARKGLVTPPVDLAQTGLPAFVLRAYSSIFIFDRNNQRLYGFEILGEEEALGRTAVMIRFEAIPPHIEDLNDWYGTAWVDRETKQPLRVVGLKADDHEQKQLFDLAIEQGSLSAHRRAHFFDEIDVEFAVERGGIRFPSRVVLRRTTFQTDREADYLRTPPREQFRIVQSYDNYRIFDVRAAETPGRIAEP